MQRHSFSRIDGFWGRTLGAAVMTVLLGSSMAQATDTPVKKILMVLPRDETNVEIAFRDYLKKSNASTEVELLRYSGREADGPTLVAQVKKAEPDLIYTWGTGTTLAVAGAYDTSHPEEFVRHIPIIFTAVTDPVGAKIVSQLSPPKRNVTGVIHVAPLQVQLNAIRSYRPFTRLGYFIDPKEPNSQLVLQALRNLGVTMKFELVEEAVPLDAQGNPVSAELPGMVARMAEKKIDLLYIGPSTFLAFTHRDLLTQSALDAGVPTFCATETVVRKAKCLFGLFANGNNVGRFAAFKATQVLYESKPVNQIPAETLQRFSLLINMPTAKSLKLYPPLSLLNVAEVLPLTTVSQ